ncbi:hypothetical protein [Winogradskyella sp. PG-2]|uniref:hypothetical protein n=1 Tax=Winogradskyella sp. PG-2 TaxID=754409 RepID=UPI0004588FCE|nr:hypothetical protein [Winogradskyella sp. PG-2]BAO74818.1 hypothetical protein WPG_0588 [Winogradskyella sp. PG-2]
MHPILKKHKYLVITLVIIFLTALWFSLLENGNYGTTLFFTIPGTIAFLIGYSRSFNGGLTKTIKKGLKGFILIMLLFAVFCGFLIAIGLEGAICVLMAYPFLVIPMTITYTIGLGIGNADKNLKRNSIILIVLMNPTTYIYDSYTEPIKEEVITELIVNVSKEKIWNDLSNEIVFEKTPMLLFEKGISYPKSIQLDDNKHSYLCITNNDTINLDIINFKANSQVTFKPREQTIPMRELTPYDSIDAEHLHNYFFVNYGQITLKPLDINTTKIIAKTSYNYKIAPKWYWKLWSNYTINEMQLHVLNSINDKYDY